MISVRAFHGEDDHLVSGAVLGPARDIQESAIGERPPELPEHEVAAQVSLHRLDGRDHADRDRLSGGALLDPVRDHDAVDDGVGAGL